MRAHRVGAVWIVVVAMLVGGTAWAGSAKKQQDTDMAAAMQKEMEVWMKLAQPGAHHEHLAPFVGTWKGKVSMWMAPGAEPMVNDSVTEVSWIMGGRYLEWVHTGEFGGMPFEGRAIEGYNNGDKRYESIWIDNFGTLILNYTGSCSDDGKAREMSTQFSDPVGGGTIGYRSEYTWVDEDHFTFTAFMDRGDGEYKSMEIKYERQK